MKIGFFITARLKSTRLKKKILLDLNGKPVIQRIIDRCKKVIGLDGVVLCTSTNPQDAPLYDFALENRIKLYMGSEEDVLDRLLSAAIYYGFDAFLSITADNPLFCIKTSQILLDWYREESKDFIFTKNLPIGCATSLLRVKALNLANKIKKESNTEIWGPFVNRPDIFNIGEVHVMDSDFNETKRLTLDYPEDYQLLNTLYKLQNNETPGLVDVFKVLSDNNNLWDINSNRRQLLPSRVELTEINEWFKTQENNIKLMAKKLDVELHHGLHFKEVNLK